MRLTNYSDYSLRVLIYLASQDREQLSNIKDIAEAYDISKNHLMKIIYNLGKLGYIETIRGRNGGFRLAMDPARINLGEVIRKTEEDFYLVDCFQDEKNCLITSACSLKHVLASAMEAFFQVLDRFSLEDVAANNVLLKELFRMKQLDVTEPVKPV
ncbi:RrF2 family transcriptional regulator [Peribacillus sp. SCS-155]|uniref:RrF2 family transcriptional regulator n=1 Tax=Peribacillus sedimenti TaxID=3115297 RepID=UPI0039060BE6